MRLPQRKNDVRIQVTRTVFAEYASRFHIRKNTILDGHLDGEGNFCQDDLTIFPSHFKILGRFYFRKAK